MALDTWSLIKKVKRPGEGVLPMPDAGGQKLRERCLVVGRQADWRLGLSQLVCPEEPVWAVATIPNHKGFFHVAFEHIQMLFEWH